MDTLRATGDQPAIKRKGEYNLVRKISMPLTRDKIIGFDPKSMTYRFMMLDGNRPLECSASNAVFNYLEKNRYPTGNPDALFLRWRETVEKAISDKFDSIGNPDAVSIHLFLKDFKFGLVNKT